MDAGKDLELLIRSRHGVVAVETYEEARLESLLREVAGRLGLALYAWTVSEGLRRDGQEARVYDSADPARALANLEAIRVDAIWLFKDLHRFLDVPEIVRRLKDLSRVPEGRRRTIVLAAPSLSLPPELEKCCARLVLGLPDPQELKRLVHDVVGALSRTQHVRVELDQPAYERLIEGLKGLTLFEAERAVTRAVLDDAALTVADVEAVNAAKRQILSEGGMLEVVAPDAKAPSVGGLRRFQDWIQRRRGAFTQDARAFGLPPPKGVVLLGVQGCGKSMAARFVAAAWGLPLLKLEAGRLYDKYLGESEKNLDRVLRLAEHLAPCVLLIDEIEKGVGVPGDAESDGGVSRRILGRFLGWLQDRKAPVFVVATCNRVEQVPPELLRKGRFDEIFFVDLPDAKARAEILALHLLARGREPGTFDLPRLAELAEGFSGAELEQAVVSALYAAFAARGALDTDMLAAEIRGTRPLSVTRREDVEALRAWARGRAVPAD
jgi:hypothetical protein